MEEHATEQEETAEEVTEEEGATEETGQRADSDQGEVEQAPEPSTYSQVEIVNYEEVFQYLLDRQEEAEQQTKVVTERGEITIKHEITLGEITVTLTIISFMIFYGLKHIITTVWRR